MNDPNGLNDLGLDVLMERVVAALGKVSDTDTIRRLLCDLKPILELYE